MRRFIIPAIVICLSTLLGLYLIFLYTEKEEKWTCVEGSCEKIKPKRRKKVRFSPKIEYRIIENRYGEI